MASYCQESTRYCNYGKGKFGEEITVIEPCFLEPGSRAYDYWRDACEGVEIRYFDMLAEGCTPQEARSVLPNSLKTEVVMTAFPEVALFTRRTSADAGSGPDPVGQGSLADSGVLR